MDKNSLISAQNAIKKIAKRDGVSIEYVRSQIQLAMLNGLCSTDPQVKRYWNSISREGKIPTPEELIIHLAKIAEDRKVT